MTRVKLTQPYQCNRCKRNKPLSEYQPKHRICEPCRREVDRDYQRDSYARCPEYKAKYSAERWRNDPEWRLAKLARDRSVRQRRYNNDPEFRQRIQGQAVQAVRRYQVRKCELPNTLTDEQWQYALEYFGNCCAVCGRKAAAGYTIGKDHWIPLSYDEDGNPGTVASNIVPLCNGVGGCNNSKGDKEPYRWLIHHYGVYTAQTIDERISTYFASLVKRRVK